MSPAADVGVFGGSGFYSFLDSVEEVEIDTPFGRPSDPVSIGSVGDTRVAFIPRHGRDHRHTPTLVPARANLWAFRTLGVTSVIGPCAAGSLQSNVHPGDFVVLDQLVDRTWGRPDTFYDAGLRHHVSLRIRTARSSRGPRPTPASGSAWQCTTAERWWWCKARASPRVRSRRGTGRRVGRSST